MNIKCCKNCTKRCVGCHSTCEDYIRERKELDEFNRRRDEQRRIELCSYKAPKKYR